MKDFFSQIDPLATEAELDEAEDLPKKVRGYNGCRTVKNQMDTENWSNDVHKLVFETVRRNNGVDALRVFCNRPDLVKDYSGPENVEDALVERFGFPYTGTELDRSEAIEAVTRIFLASPVSQYRSPWTYEEAKDRVEEVFTKYVDGANTYPS